jgi:hypothetical protein
MTDQPSAGLVLDLKRRGLLDSTVVLWTGEFGRLPISQGTDGRDHNRHAFSLWLAGGGFKKVRHDGRNEAARSGQGGPEKNLHDRVRQGPENHALKDRAAVT